MLKPPFKLAASMHAAQLGLHGGIGCCDAVEITAETAPAGRVRLGDLDPHLHCSVIGTCLGTAELRKLMARFLFVRDCSDVEVHHEAVSHASQAGPVAKALHKLLEHRHEAAVQRFAQAQGAPAIAVLWEHALQRGEIPGAYWAVLTHRDATPELRQKVFGEVHMLSHLVGAAHRSDIRRVAALELDNAEWRDRAQRQQQRSQALLDERDRLIAELRQQLANAGANRSPARVEHETASALWRDELAAVASLVALHTGRRERAEQAAAVAGEEATRLRLELEHLRGHVDAVHRELTAAETQLRDVAAGADNAAGVLVPALSGRRILYVGGRPSSTPAIRDLVLRHGGDFQRHDGGLEDRKGLLASAVGWAQLVVFPVDCIDHDSAGNLKRLCARHGVAFLPLRSASVASFAAALASPSADDPDEPGRAGCIRHG